MEHTAGEEPTISMMRHHMQPQRHFQPLSRIWQSLLPARPWQHEPIMPIQFMQSRGMRQVRVEAEVDDDPPLGPLELEFLRLEAEEKAKAAEQPEGSEPEPEPEPEPEDEEEEEAVVAQVMQYTAELPQFLTTDSGTQMPRIMYGLGWAKTDHKNIVVQALAESGFPGLDVGRQNKAYESAVGEGLAEVFQRGIQRDSLFIQGRIGPVYMEMLAPGAPIADQVQASIEATLSNLGLDYIDSLVLQTTYPDHKKTMEAWTALEEAVQTGKVRVLGVSDAVLLDDLKKLYKSAKVKPSIVQERTSNENGFRSDTRDWCSSKGVDAQSVNILSLWRAFQNTPGNLNRAQMIAQSYGVPARVLFLRFTMGLGLVPLIDEPLARGIESDLVAWQVALSKGDAEMFEMMVHPDR
eukprot:gnl/TRDRNA2_/TRDRNA2_164621_c2_seq3.p1 gnl/TRDRNA2_/TRDRNA2_164621_c2~~gnl/TRDRNA2_/TRDRNA2_164621_c2_seq3.p1  ORF type:complete len:474 (+),score=62.17 gnl/TRDRNA2_/TRDRNA2_164621_c2_seq3:201-1424(+)